MIRASGVATGGDPVTFREKSSSRKHLTHCTSAPPESSRAQNVSTSDRVCDRCRPADLGHRRCRLCPRPAGRTDHGTTHPNSLAGRSIEQRLQPRRRESSHSSVLAPQPRVARRPPLAEKLKPASRLLWTSPCEGYPKAADPSRSSATQKCAPRLVPNHLPTLTSHAR